MDSGRKEINGLYGKKLRIRACGLCISHERILMIRHKSLGKDGIFWSPPGGGMQFGENAPDAIKREFEEETGLIVKVGEMLFVNEFIATPLHAVELFFEIENFSGNLYKGVDPEFPEHNQIIEEVRFMSMKEIKELPEGQVHSLFKNCDTIADVLSIRGYLR